MIGSEDETQGAEDWKHSPLREMDPDRSLQRRVEELEIRLKQLERAARLHAWELE